MKNSNKKKIAWRKWAILSSFLALIIIAIVATYITEYNKTKVIPFEEDVLTTLESQNQIDDFDFDFYCKNYEKAGDKGSKSMVFTATVENAKEGYTFSSIKYTVAMGDRRWTKNYTTGSQTTITSSFKSGDKIKEKDSTISNYSFTYPKRKLLFIKIETPTVFVKLNYTRKKGTKTENLSYFLEYEYDEYFRSGVTIIG